MSGEKRRFTRIPFKVMADIRIAGRGISVDGIRNLSVGGCLVSLNEPFETGTACQMDIWMTGSSSDLKVSVDGEIVRGDPLDTAIKFTRIDPDSLYHLRNIIRYNSSDSDKVEDELNTHPGLR
jgi:hypothetical protein